MNLSMMSKQLLAISYCTMNMCAECIIYIHVCACMCVSVCVS